ncbi:MAG: hypothetical protein QOH21_716, partial [Acidobacteriota bacterium]|nr:hypothetical protein [Acidobacteriota bacterium]
MSNYKAIATVTEALRITLNAALQDEMGAGVTATATRPDQAGTGASANIYLYQVTPNASLRNADLPTRDSAGVLKQRPRAALDLHYLLSVYGKETDHEPQRILGIVVRTMHTTPLLSATAIKDAIGPLPADPLFGSDLGDAAEHVRFTPQPLSLDDQSKLWSVFFQTKYALSVAYVASVVFIEPDDQPAAPLPVLTRNVSVIPSFGPEIGSVTSSPSLNAPPDNDRIVAGRVLHVQGRNLQGANTRLLLGGEEVTPAIATVQSDRILLELKNPPITQLRAGLTSVTVVYDMDFGGGGGPHPVESNAIPFALAPKITAIVLKPASIDLTV